MLKDESEVHSTDNQWGGWKVPSTLIHSNWEEINIYKIFKWILLNSLKLSRFSLSFFYKRRKNRYLSTKVNLKYECMPNATDDHIFSAISLSFIHWGFPFKQAFLLFTHSCGSTLPTVTVSSSIILSLFLTALTGLSFIFLSIFNYHPNYFSPASPARLPFLSALYFTEHSDNSKNST